MTHQQETRYRCDRCGTEATLPHNSQPSLERGQPPEGWAVLIIGNPTHPPQHLCPKCNTLFGAFMLREVP